MSYLPSNSPSLLGHFGTLSSINKNRDYAENYHKKGKNFQSGFYKDYGNSVEAITGINSRGIIPSSKTDIYNTQNIDIDTNKYSYQSKPYGISNNYNDNYYGTSSQSSKKKQLASSVMTGSDFIYDKYLDKKKYNNNYDYINEINTNNNNKNSNLNSIISSRVGLTNLGNTCFMNTCLQNLIHSEDFINRLLSKSYEINSNKPITLKFWNLCKQMAETGKGYITPSEFKLKFGSKHIQFSGYGQNDTQEFCRILLEDMNKELNEVRKKAPYKELDTSNKPKIQCDEEYDELFRKRESSIVMDSFYGQIITTFTCKCKLQTYSFQKILDLPLLLNSKGSVSLYDLLDDYFETDEIQFETKCEKCRKKRVYHTKETKFSRPPNILILSLQRINYREKRKNNCYVDFPELLNIKKYIDDECGHENECQYELYGIGNHSGTINFGHYFAYIKLNDKDWYEFNDSMVSKIGRINTRSYQAYILFYKKK